MTRLHAFSDDALGTLDAVGVAEGLRAGGLSASEAVEAAIARTEQVADALGALAHRAFDQARREARESAGPGFFAGVPTVVKDNVDVAGMPTRSGADAWEAKPAKAHGDFAEMFLATGLINLGKSQLSEYGFSASAEHPRLGPVVTPWNTEHVAGASSAGSAALVAAGAVPIAHANDGGGSIRIPAAVNGLVGLKPTRGRLAQDKQMRQMPVRIISDGVVTRSVRDTAAFMREAEAVYRNLKLPPIGDVTRPGKHRLRIGVNTSGLGHGADAETTEQTLKVAALLEELGHQVEEVAPPVDAGFPDDFLLYWGSLAFFLLTLGRREHGPTWDPSKHDNLTLGLARRSKRMLHRLPGAIRRLRATSARAADFFEGYDVALTPTLAHETPRLGYLDPTQDFDTVIERLMAWVAFTPLQNATGDPAISLPLATSSQGLPMGMMIAAGAGQEARLLGLAYELEEAVPFATIGEA